MKLQDLITLATQGYKLAEIKELVALADNGQDETIQETKDSSKESPEVDAHKEGEEEREPEVEKDVIDYKTLYEEEKKKVEELQNANIRKDNSGQDGEDTDKILEDIVRNFM